MSSRPPVVRSNRASRVRVSASALIAVFLVVLASSATAASSAAVPACNRVASPAGRDSARGTLRSPYRTFKRLVQSLRPGMVGCLRGGSYGDGTTTQAIYHGGSAGQRMTIRGYRREQATVAGPVFISDTADYVTIRHVTIEGATKLPSGEKRLALEIWGRNFIFEDSVLTSHSGGRSGILLRGDRPLIRRNKIHDVGTVGSEFGYAHGIYVAESRGFKIERNWIYDCPVGWGVQLFPHAIDGVVAQNVIDGCGSGITITGDHTANSTHGNRIE